MNLGGAVGASSLLPAVDAGGLGALGAQELGRQQGVLLELAAQVVRVLERGQVDGCEHLLESLHALELLEDHQAVVLVDPDHDHGHEDLDVDGGTVEDQTLRDGHHGLEVLEERVEAVRNLQMSPSLSLSERHYCYIIYLLFCQYL